MLRWLPMIILRRLLPPGIFFLLGPHEGVVSPVGDEGLLPPLRSCKAMPVCRHWWWIDGSVVLWIVTIVEVVKTIGVWCSYCFGREAKLWLCDWRIWTIQSTQDPASLRFEGTNPHTVAGVIHIGHCTWSSDWHLLWGADKIFHRLLSEVKYELNQVVSV